MRVQESDPWSLLRSPRLPFALLARYAAQQLQLLRIVLVVVLRVRQY